MDQGRDVVVIGAGGHALVCIEVLREAGFTVVGCVSEDGTAAADLGALGVPMLGPAGEMQTLIERGHRRWFVAIGDNAARHRVAGSVEAAGGELVTAISASARVSPTARIAPGALVMPGTVVNALANVARGAIVNTGATVDHECHVGEFAHVAPQAALAGRVAVGARALVGIGARVVPGVTVGSSSIVGAGAVVLDDVDASATVAGVPARPLRGATPTPPGPNGEITRAPVAAATRDHTTANGTRDAPPHVMFVCTGNICRSPLAAALLRVGLEHTGVHCVVSSTGLAAPPDQPPDDKLMRVADELGVADALAGHRSRQLTVDDLAETDLVVTMTLEQQQLIERMAPGFTRITTLRAAAWRAQVMSGRPVEFGQWADRLTSDLSEGGSPDPLAGDIADPTGGRLRQYRAMGAEVRDLVRALVDGWSGG